MPVSKISKRAKARKKMIGAGHSTRAARHKNALQWEDRKRAKAQGLKARIAKVKKRTARRNKHEVLQEKGVL